MRKASHAFTLAEVLISMAVLVVLVLLFTRLFNGAAAITTLSNRYTESDGQVRQLFDRMSIDFAQMVKRSDVQCYVKQPVSPTSAAHTFSGNDRLAFYSMVPGDYPSSGSESPFSLIAYKVNSSTAVANAAIYTRLQRMARGLLMNGDSNLSDVKDGPIIFGPTTLDSLWSSTSAAGSIGSNATTDSKHELAAPQVFRFEYYYLLADGSLTVTPWVTGHTDVNGMRDVSAIIVAIATIDSKSHILVTNAQIDTIAGTLVDYSTGSGHGPGWLLGQWQSVLNTPTVAAIKLMPRPALSAIRLYERYFYLTPAPQ